VVRRFKGALKGSGSRTTPECPGATAQSALRGR